MPMLTRREMLRTATGAALASTLFVRGARGASDRPNLLLITLDDMNWDSAGYLGCRVPDITPNLDRLSRESLSFERAHVASSICQPCRQSLMTGLYPHSNSLGAFDPVFDGVPTLQQLLHEVGYFNANLGKEPHLAPERLFCWDALVTGGELGAGRNPDLYYRHTLEAIRAAQDAGRPFAIVANSHDPHKPFVGDPGDATLRAGERLYGEPDRIYTPDEVEVRGFLPDLPEVREELAGYFSSLRRGDRTVGAVLRALRESGAAEDTIVTVLSDNGMAFPFAKTNCYYASTRTPFLVRWPGRVAAGAADREQLVCGVDWAPTMLDALDLPPLPRAQGVSFLPALLGGGSGPRQHLVTEINATSARRAYPMRAIHDGEYCYILNAWADGATEFINAARGPSFRAMQVAAESDPEVASRMRLFLYRKPEELYDTNRDRDSLVDLAGRPEHQERLRSLRRALLTHMLETRDPVASALR